MLRVSAGTHGIKFEISILEYVPYPIQNSQENPFDVSKVVTTLLPHSTSHGAFLIVQAAAAPAFQFQHCSLAGTTLRLT